MAKITAWLVTIIGILLILPALKVTLPAWITTWIIPLLVLIIGITKLIRNYSSKRR